MGRSRQKKAACSRAERSRISSLTAARLQKADKQLMPSTADPRIVPTSSMTAVPSSPSSLSSSPIPSSSATPMPSSTPTSASKRKLDMFSADVPPVQTTAATLPTTIVDLNCLQPLFEQATCSACSSRSLRLYEGDGSKSFCVNLNLICTFCGEINSSATTSKKTSKMSQMNRSVVATGLTMGIGHAGIQKLSEGLGMRGMHHTSYLQHMEEIFSKTHSIAEVILSLSREKVRTFYKEHFTDSFTSDGMLNLPVSFDGSWPKRGHTSKLGFGAAIDVRTGLVVDFHVMSLHCQVCASVGERLRRRSGEAEYKTWLDNHRELGTCTQNFEGSSGAMEVEAALVLWRRSLQHQMRYVTLVGDGDTKTYLAITKAKPYGDVAVVKEECVNHVAKRLNTGLRNLKSSLGKQSIRIGGNSKGSLTDPKIGLLQSYYTKAVRGTDSVEAMSKAIWAAYHHSTSKHDDCPPGTESWCWFQRDRAQGIHDPQLGTRKQSTFLNEMVAGHVKSVYERLTDPTLLNRCLLGVTQNTNESLHSLIWLRCPKHLWSGYKRVYTACLLGVGEYNMGSLATRIFLDGVGCSMTELSVLLGEKRDKKRVAKAGLASQEVAKKRREVRKLAQQKEQIRCEEREGGSSYVAGGF